MREAGRGKREAGTGYANSASLFPLPPSRFPLFPATEAIEERLLGPGGGVMILVLTSD
jgi:hypothetical protein